MFQIYVETINTPGAVPSVIGAWEAFIGQKSGEMLTIGNVVYFHEMKERFEGKLPCDSSVIRDYHDMAFAHVKFNVFDEAVESEGISCQYIKESISSFEVSIFPGLLYFSLF